jgi:hypothetical protein
MHKDIIEQVLFVLHKADEYFEIMVKSRVVNLPLLLVRVDHTIRRRVSLTDQFRAKS